MNSLFLKRMCIGAALSGLGAVAVWAQNDAKELYGSKCGVCHGPDGMAQTTMGKKLKMKSVKEVKMTADEMGKLVTNGKPPGMPAFGKQLSGDQIKGVVEYYRGLAK